ncbi:TolC family protein [Segetibacter koreensis]|uniref:TolC family protein n=1 Tax=Segetibacter koreensis TaxID=398037 RepID=UPI00035FF891|nr:TolC family protein [Segetibacter koreensis]
MSRPNYTMQLKGATQRCLIVILTLVQKKFFRSFTGLLLLALTSPFAVFAQQQVLTLENVLDIVKKYHPVARQAALGVDSARAALLAARGGFDPSIYVNNQQKTFNGKNYYFYTNPELKIPTWYGVDLKAGLEDNGGERITREATQGRSSYVGVTVPLLKNLATDKRRTTVQQAKITVRQSEAARLNEVNNLLYDAASAYWNWVKEYGVFKIFEEAVAINEQRIKLVRGSFAGGDRAAIDTVEALTQLQNFQLLASEAQVRWMTSGFELSNFLWLDNDQPYELSSNVVPDTLVDGVKIENNPIPSLEDILLTAKANHPKLQTYDRKLDALQAERRLKFQSMLPTLNVNYNFLSKGYKPWKGIGQNVFENNYKYGFEFGLPLLLRQGRGDYKTAKIKIQINQLEKDQVGLEIENKIKKSYNQLLALRQQVKIGEDAYDNYLRLLKAEEVKFSIGESSLFLLNSRESKVLEARQKLLELKTKFFKELVALQWSAGTLGT